MSAHIDFRAVAEESLAAQPMSNFYFLLDHGGLPGLCSKLSKSSLNWASLFACKLEASALEAAPILVLVGSKGKVKMSRDLFEWIGREGTYSSTVIALSSPLQFEMMARRLAERLDIKLSDDMEAMIRFFDPRVLESLIEVLSVEQLNAFLSVADIWRIVDRSGKLMRIDSIFNSVDERTLPLKLSQEQEFRLVDLSEVDQVLSMLRSHVSDLASKLPLSFQYNFVSQKIEEAKGFGLNSALKFAIYIAMQLFVKEPFVGSVLWSGFLDELKKDEVDFSRILNSEAVEVGIAS